MRLVACRLLLSEVGDNPSEEDSIYMNRTWRLVLVTVASVSAVGLMLILTLTTAADVPPDWCVTEPGAGDEVHTICVPEDWNGGLILWAHGYVFSSEPITISHIYLPGMELSIPEIAGLLGYAFAASSYSKNGYAVEEGIEDTHALYHQFVVSYAEPTYTYILGASEGGLITVKLMESYPDIFDGGLALCGPIGGLHHEMPHVADFRLVFDYFFPDLLRGNAISVPLDAWQYWETGGPDTTEQGYYYDIIEAIQDHPWRTAQLFTVTEVCTDWQSPESVADSATHLLSYSIFATNDMSETVGGNPYDNQSTWYRGSYCDWCLNRPGGVDRFQADPGAVEEIMRFAPTGEIEAPLVTLHTTCDPLVPFWNELIYWKLAQAQGNADKLLVLPSRRYGHCTFEVREVLLAFAALVYRVEGHLPRLSRFESVDTDNLPGWVTTFESKMDLQSARP